MTTGVGAAARTSLPPRRRWVRALLIVLATILLAGGILSVASSPPPSQDEVDARERTRPIDARPRRDHERSEAVARPQGAAVARDDARAPVRHERARREALREQILAREQARRSSASATAPGPASGDREAPTAEAPALLDRIGGRDDLVQLLQRDLMPLADECIAMATERDPALRGMLALEFEVLADAELGAVIEAVTPAVDSTVTQPELLECMRESSLSLSFPPPPSGGRDAFVLSMRLGEDDPAADG